MKPKTPALCLTAICLLFLSAGCSAVADAPGARAGLFFDRLNRYPQTREALRIPKLTATAFKDTSQLPVSPDVFIMVHPGYSLFFRDVNKARYSDEKYALLIRQFENEARFISRATRSGKIVVLIVPGKYQSESAAPLSYTSYLNRTAAGRSVFYLYSTSASSGSISMNDMIDLYRFLQHVKVGKVMVGGGYIGRCQREFFNAVTAYFDQASSFIVPEISTISPDDISDFEAVSILESMQRQDYTPVRKFIDGKLDKPVNILSLPQRREPQRKQQP